MNRTPSPHRQLSGSSIPSKLLRGVIVLTVAASLTTATALIVNSFGQWLLLFVPAAATILFAADQVRRWRFNAVVRQFRRAHPAKDLLLVYTDSPHWLPCIEGNWLPRWGGRAVVLNRSLPWSPEQPEAGLWRAANSMEDEHTPLAVVVPRQGKITVVRLFKAFRDHKHGKAERLRVAEQEIEAALGATVAGNARATGVSLRQ